MSVWFTSDPHFGHGKVAELRGFSSVMEHDAAIVDSWRQQVAISDTVWVLGDLAASGPHHALRVLAGLPGVKHLVAGNHDKCHPMNRGAHNHQGTYLEVFKSVQPFARRKIDGKSVLLSHFPYHADRGPARYTQYRLRDEGLWLLHGHTHGPERLHDGHEIHVGLDAWDLHLVSLDQVADLMLAGT